MIENNSQGVSSNYKKQNFSILVDIKIMTKIVICFTTKLQVYFPVPILQSKDLQSFNCSTFQHQLLPSSKTMLFLRTGSKWCRCVMFIARDLLERWSFLQEISVKLKKSITSAAAMAKMFV